MRRYSPTDGLESSSKHLEAHAGGRGRPHAVPLIGYTAGSAPHCLRSLILYRLGGCLWRKDVDCLGQTTTRRAYFDLGLGRAA